MQTGVKLDFGWSVDFKADPVPDADNKVAFEDMLSKLSADAASFVVFDFADTKADGRQIKKLVLIKWCPDSVNFRIKPVVGSTYQVRIVRAIPYVWLGGLWPPVRGWGFRRGHS